MTPTQFIRRSITSGWSTRAMSIFNVVSGVTAVLTVIGAVAVIQLSLVPPSTVAACVLAFLLAWMLGGAYRGHLEDERAHDAALEEIRVERSADLAELSRAHDLNRSLTERVGEAEALNGKSRRAVAIRLDDVENVHIDNLDSRNSAGAIDATRAKGLRVGTVKFDASKARKPKQ
jgi:hypothetical protein